MMNKKIIILVSLLFSTSVFASSNNSAATTNIAELFPYAAQSHNSKGKFNSKWGAYIVGSRGNEVDFKNYDNLYGMCYNDKHEYENKEINKNYHCKISESLAKSYKLDKFDDGKNSESEIWLLKAPTNLPNGNKEINCDYGSSKGIHLKDSNYKSIVVDSNCTLEADTTDVIIKNNLTLNNGVLALKPGNYWVDSLIISNGKIIPTSEGVINFYVNKNVEIDQIKDRLLGSVKSPVNFFVKKDFSIKGAKVTGAVRAQVVTIGDEAQINIPANEYWYEKLLVKSTNPMEVIGGGLTTLHVKDIVELQGGVNLNINDKLLFLVLYDNRQNTLDVKGGAHFHGHVYTKGGIEMHDGAKITGAVNVHSLIMKGGSNINYSPLNVIFNAKPDHYRIYLNKSLTAISATACADEKCTLYKSTVNKLQIVDTENNGTEIINFTDFNDGTTSEKNISSKKKNRMTFAIKDTVGKAGADPWPTAQPPLRCFIDGQESNCRVGGDNPELSAYVYGELEITADALGTTNNAELTIDDIVGQGILTNTKTEDELTKNMAVTLPITVSYDKAELVTLKVKETLPNQLPIYREVKMAFVPKQLRWVVNADSQCVNRTNKFVYNSLHTSCVVLAKAGDNAGLTLQAIGANEKVIEQYQTQEGVSFSFNELDENSQSISSSEANFGINVASNEQKIGYVTKNVALIQAKIDKHCASYASKNINSECSLFTEGDTVILGRTVPAYLTVANKRAGIIENDAAYRGKEVVFTDNPYFEVMGCAKGQEKDKCSLPSYKGEFAQDLTQYASITLEDSAEHEEIVGAVNQFELEDKEGAHQLELVVDLIPPKKQPQAVTPIEDKLVLKIEGHDGLDELTGKVLIAEKKAQLRYGFLTIDNLELLTRTAGDMPLHLHYYGDTLKEIKEDTKTNLELTASKNNVYLQLADNSPTLELDSNDKKLTVKKHDTEWSGTVELTVEPWLQPYNEAQLKNPEANLVISEQARKRGHDRVFNRREAVQ